MRAPRTAAPIQLHMGNFSGARAFFSRPRDQAAGFSAMAPAIPVRQWIERRWTVLAGAVLLFVLVFVLRQTSSSSHEMIETLYVVPIALIALELGLVAGICSVVLALGLLAIWWITADAHIGAVGFLATGVAYLAVGAIAGRFGDRMRHVHKRQLLLLESGLLLAHIDSPEDLPATLARQAHDLVSSSWARAELSDEPVAEAGAPKGKGEEEIVPIEVRGTRYGTLTVRSARPTGSEDHATLEILALQAAVAAENRRLLASERDRAMIRAELRDARLHLADRGGQLRELITRHEAERHQLAHELNEQAAQSLAAVLLGLAALERELGSGVAAPRLEALRSDVDFTLRSLRSLAVSLRPPVLELGLRTALERLADAAHVRGFGSMEVALPDAGGLSQEVETMVYRVVEETLAAVGTASRVSVRSHDGSQIAVDVEGAQQEIAHERLAVLRARMELVGGTLTATPTELRAVIPLRSAENHTAPERCGAGAKDSPEGAA